MYRGFFCSCPARFYSLIPRCSRRVVKKTILYMILSWRLPIILRLNTVEEDLNPTATFESFEQTLRVKWLQAGSVGNKQTRHVARCHRHLIHSLRFCQSPSLKLDGCWIFKFSPAAKSLWFHLRDPTHPSCHSHRPLFPHPLPLTIKRQEAWWAKSCKKWQAIFFKVFAFSFCFKTCAIWWKHCSRVKESSCHLGWHQGTKFQIQKYDDDTTTSNPWKIVVQGPKTQPETPVWLLPFLPFIVFLHRCTLVISAPVITIIYLKDLDGKLWKQPNGSSSANLDN